MMLTYWYTVFALVGLFLVLGFALRGGRERAQREGRSAAREAAIRVTDHEGRDMKIIRKKDGSFVMVEESKDASSIHTG